MTSVLGVPNFDGLQMSGPISSPVPPETQFQSVAIGAGGFVTGISFSDDGATRVVRTDGFGGYRWADGKWQLMVSSQSLPTADIKPGLGGGVLAVAVAPSDASIVYMAFNHSLYRSADGATTWARVLSGVSTAANDNFRSWGSRLAVDPTDPDVVFYGSQLGGLYISHDGGFSWRQTDSGVVPTGLLVDIDSPSTRGRIDRPTNVLEQDAHLAGAGVSAIAFDRSGPVVNGNTQVVYAASYGNGVYRSADSGSSWQKISPDGLNAVGYLRVLSNGDVVASSHADPTDLTGPADLWRYRGGAWSTTGPSRQANWRAIAEDPSTPGQVALMGQGGSLALSRDYGASWIYQRRTQASDGDVSWLSWALNYGAVNFMSVGEIAFDPITPGRLWFTEGTGVWYADIDAGGSTVNWHSQSRGIEQLVPTGVLAPPGGKPLLTAWDRPIFRSEDVAQYPETYGPANQFGSAWSIDWSVSDPGYVVANVASHQWPSDPTNSGYSTDGGRTWTPFPTIPLGSTNAVTTFGFGSIAVGAPGNVVWVPAYGKRPQYTKDGGATWNELSLPGVTNYGLVDAKPYFVNRQVIAADKATPGTFYLYVLNTGVFRTTDGGDTWIRMSDNAAMQKTDYGWSVTLKAVPGHEGELFLTPGLLSGTTTQPFKHSTDAGRTWSTVPGLTGVTAFGFGKAFPGSDSPAVYAAGYLDGDYGVYRSTDNAHTWTYLTAYPASRTPRVVAVDGDKDMVGRVYLAVGGSSVVFGDSAATTTPPDGTDEGPTTDPTPTAPPVPTAPVPTASTPLPATSPASPSSGPKIKATSSAAQSRTIWTSPRLTKRFMTAKLRLRAGGPLAGRKVQVQVRRRANGPWTHAATRTTSSRGFATFRISSKGTVWVRFALPAGSGLDEAYSKGAQVGAGTTD